MMFFTASYPSRSPFHSGLHLETPAGRLSSCSCLTLIHPRLHLKTPTGHAQSTPIFQNALLSPFLIFQQLSGAVVFGQVLVERSHCLFERNVFNFIRTSDSCACECDQTAVLPMPVEVLLSRSLAGVAHVATNADPRSVVLEIGGGAEGDRAGRTGVGAEKFLCSEPEGKVENLDQNQQ